jgi:hypothetical protein
MDLFGDLTDVDAAVVEPIKKRTGERFYRDTAAGRFVAHTLTAFFCRRAGALGITESDWLAGKLTTRQLWKSVFDRSAVERELMPLMPNAHLWWAAAYPDSNAVGRTWWEWFSSGRGPIRGWLYQLLRYNRGRGKGYVNSLRRWEKRSGVSGRWVPLAYEPRYNEYNPAATVNEDLSQNGRRPITLNEAEAVYRNGFGRCHYCDCPIGGCGEPYQIDHFLKRSAFRVFRAWLDIVDNYVPACLACHDEKTRDDLNGNEIKGRVHARREERRLRGRT